MSEENKYWMNTAGVQTFSLAILATIGLALSLSFTKKIMVPFVLSLLLYFILSPLRMFFIKKLRLPKWLALLMTFSVVALVLTVIVSVLFSAIQEFGNGYALYESKAVYFADSIQDWLIEKGVPLAQLNFSKVISNLPIGELVKGAGAGVFSLFSTSLLVFIFLIFLFTGTVKRDTFTEPSEVVKEINDKIRKYLGVKLLTSLATGTITFIILSFLGLDLAFLFSFLAFVLNFIPTIGSLFAVALPIPVAFFQYDTFWPVGLVILLPGVLQFTIGNVIEPRVMGVSLNLHPVTVLLSLMFWSLIWGVAGAFLAVPITAILKIILEKIEGGRAIARVMSGSIDV